MDKNQNRIQLSCTRINKNQNSSSFYTVQQDAKI
jgi:hypothetical protein